MSQMPLVSIIVPTYNRLSFLKRTLDSLINQTYKNFELIIVDDNSQDDTALYVNSLNLGIEMTYVKNQSNLGESKSVNIGWCIATGELVTIINSDDPQPQIWLENMVNEFTKDPNYLIYYPNINVIDEKGNILETRILKEWVSRSVVTKLLVTSSAGAILNKKLLPNNFEPRVETSIYPSDLFQSLKIASLGSGKKVNTVFANWTLHAGNNLNKLELKEVFFNYYSTLKSWRSLNELNWVSRSIQISNFWGQIVLLAARRGVIRELFTVRILGLLIFTMLNPISLVSLLFKSLVWSLRKSLYMYGQMLHK